MNPYAGPESPLGLIALAAVLAAIGLLVLVLTLDRKEKAAEADSGGSGKGLRIWKRVSGVFFVTAVVFAGYWSLSIDGMSKQSYNENIIADIESNGVNLVQGFEDPDVPLTAESTAKFMVQSDSGLVRCRANAGGEDDPIEYVCQSENGEFLTPISEL